MKAIFLAKIQHFIRNPWNFIVMALMSVGFTLIIGTGDPSSITIPVYQIDSSPESTKTEKLLAESEQFDFKLMSQKEAETKFKNGKSDVVIELSEASYKLYQGIETPYLSMLKQTLDKTYKKQFQEKQIISATTGNKNSIKMELQTLVESPIFKINEKQFRGEGTFIYDDQLQKIFGMTLFFVMYTIAFNVFAILLEKQSGMWDRMILSSVRKSEMYIGNLVFSFIMGYIQVLIVFLTFRYVLHVDFNGKFAVILFLIIPYVLAIVSLSLLITAIAKTPQQFNAIIPIVGVSMAMISGAFWPIEIVQSKILIGLSKIMPLTYGMDLLKGIAVYGYSFSSLLYPISILILMSVLMIGVGIHYMERRHI